MKTAGMMRVFTEEKTGTIKNPRETQGRQDLWELAGNLVFLILEESIREVATAAAVLLEEALLVEPDAITTRTPRLEKKTQSLKSFKQSKSGGRQV
jgi:hypothetical protein